MNNIFKAIGFTVLMITTSVSSTVYTSAITASSSTFNDNANLIIYNITPYQVTVENDAINFWRKDMILKFTDDVSPIELFKIYSTHSEYDSGIDISAVESLELNTSATDGDNFHSQGEIDVFGIRITVPEPYTIAIFWSACIALGFRSLKFKLL